MTIPAPEMTELRAMLTKVHDWIANTIFADDERRDEAVNLDSDILATLGAHPIDTLADGLVEHFDERALIWGLARNSNTPAHASYRIALKEYTEAKASLAAALTQLRERLAQLERDVPLQLVELVVAKKRIEKRLAASERERDEAWQHCSFQKERAEAVERERDEAEDDGARMLNAERKWHAETSKACVELALRLRASEATVLALLELLVDARKHVPSDCVAKIDAALEQAKP